MDSDFDLLVEVPVDGDGADGVGPGSRIDGFKGEHGPLNALAHAGVDVEEVEHMCENHALLQRQADGVEGRNIAQQRDGIVLDEDGHARTGLTVGQAAEGVHGRGELVFADLQQRRRLCKRRGLGGRVAQHLQQLDAGANKGIAV